jgi:hypothetical protein
MVNILSIDVFFYTNTRTISSFLGETKNEHFSSASGGQGNKNDNEDSAMYPFKPTSYWWKNSKANVSEKAAPASPATCSDGDDERQHHRGSLLPFHSAVLTMADAPDHDVNLDVVFFLLRQHPDALTTRY